MFETQIVPENEANTWVFMDTTSPLNIFSELH